MNKLIGFEEVSEITSVPASTIRKMVTGKKIPCIRIGKHVRFDPDDIVLWIERSKVGIAENVRSMKFPKGELVTPAASSVTVILGKCLAPGESERPRHSLKSSVSGVVG